MKIIQALLILLLVLLFFNLAPLIIWILRLIIALGFISLAYERYKYDRIGATIIFVILALIFQPIVALHLGKILWTLLQIGVLVWLIMLIFGKEEDIF